MSLITALPFILAVGLPISIAGAIFSVRNSGEKVPFRPPGWVFGVVWPILYILTGYAWSLVNKQVSPVGPILLIIILALWLPTYKANKSAAVWVIVTAWGLTVMNLLQFWSVNHTAGYLMIPLLTWLFLATLLNSADT